jgi:hypothetical protein
LQQFCTHKIQDFARDPRIHHQNTTSQQALYYCGRRKTKTKNSSEHSSLSLSISHAHTPVWQEEEDLRLVTKLCDLKLGDLFLPQKNNRLATKKFQDSPSS